MQNETEAVPGSEAGNQSYSAYAQGEMTQRGLGREAAHREENLIPMTDNSGFSFALLITWLVATLAILAGGYFWWLGRNTADVVAEKELKLQSIEQQMKAPAMVKAEKEANDFKSSVSILSKAKKDRYSITQFLPAFYSKVTNDVKITSLAISGDGSMSISGTTKNYRTTADLIMALKSWNTLTDIKLGSVSMNTGVKDGGKPSASFSVTAKIVKTPAVATTNTTGTNGITTETPAATGVTPAQPSTGGAQ